MRSQFCGSFMALMSRSWFTVLLNWAPKTNAVLRRTNAVIIRVRDLGVIMGIIRPQVGCRHKAFGPPREEPPGVHEIRWGFRRPVLRHTTRSAPFESRPPPGRCLFL